MIFKENASYLLPLSLKSAQVHIGYTQVPSNRTRAHGVLCLHSKEQTVT